MGCGCKKNKQQQVAPTPQLIQPPKPQTTTDQKLIDTIVRKLQEINN